MKKLSRFVNLFVYGMLFAVLIIQGWYATEYYLEGETVKAIYRMLWVLLINSTMKDFK